MKPLVVGIVVVAAAVGIGFLAKSNAKKPPVDPVAEVEKDPEIAAAVMQARAELPTFVKSLTNRPDGEYAISARFKTERGNEHLWVRITDHKDTKFTGEVTSDPVAATDVKKGDTVTVEEGAIVDWTYRLDGQVYGGFTTNVLQKRGTN